MRVSSNLINFVKGLNTVKIKSTVNMNQGEMEVPCDQIPSDSQRLIIQDIENII